MKYILLFFSLVIAGESLNAQSIRKNYTEMTQSEQDELVDAFYDLRTGPDLINDLATFHNSNFSTIHFNSPSNDVFLAWHRRQIFEVEQAMQDINPNLSIPFWDWTTDNSTTSALWDNGFLGQFNSAWSLGRTLGSFGSLPTASNVTTIQAETNWDDYTDDLEGSIVHTGAHNWVGGTMASGASPRDPVFYFHHGMIDKLWHEWETTNGASSYQPTSLPRYDGTYTFNGTTLPSVDPDDIVDTKVLGVFFAENGLAELEDYTVSNTYRSLENFYYQYDIEAGNDFIVPNGKECKFESVNRIVLKVGFHAADGSEFTAKIDTDNDITTAAKRNESVASRNSKPFDDIDVILNAYVVGGTSTESLAVEAYPNPFTTRIAIDLDDEAENCEVELFDMQGRRMFKKTFTGTRRIRIADLDPLDNGIYLLKVVENGKPTVYSKITKIEQ